MKKNFTSKYQFSDIRGVQSVEKLARILAVKPEELQELAVQKDSYYCPFTDLRGKKPREIDNPVDELKDLQRKIGDRIFLLIPLSPIVYGARKGRSPKDNAMLHRKKPVIVKLDLKDCYHSTKAIRVYKLFRHHLGYSEQLARLMEQLCTYHGYVPVGSPFSPALINTILNPLWRQIEEYCKSHGLTASAWVDDLTVSGEDAHKHLEAIKQLINGYGYKISWKKKEIVRNNRAQVVTGCGVNSPKIGVPRDKRTKYRAAVVNDPNSLSTHSQLAFAEFINKNQAKKIWSSRKS